MKAGFRFSAMFITCLLVGCASRPPLATVPRVDLKRYEGRWFEIAKYPNWFQQGCAADTTAEYTAQADGRIAVVNRCRQKMEPSARRGSGNRGARLEQREAPCPLCWQSHRRRLLDHRP
jgi:apolipoprotein D and lipocalin family protein